MPQSETWESFDDSDEQCALQKLPIKHAKLYQNLFSLACISMYVW